MRNCVAWPQSYGCDTRKRRNICGAGPITLRGDRKSSVHFPLLEKRKRAAGDGSGVVGIADEI